MLAAGHGLQSGGRVRERSQQVIKAGARQDDHPLCMYEILPRYPAGVGRSVALTSTEASSQPT